MGGVRERADLVGCRFGALLALRKDHSDFGAHWQCKCDCGSVVVRRVGDLLRRERNGRQQSCGCLRARTQDAINFRCGKCGKAKPREEFYVDSKSASGIHGHCKACNKEWRLVNKCLLQSLHRSYVARFPEKMAVIYDSYRRANLHRYAQHSARRRLQVEQATPAWSNLEVINDIYKLAQEFREAGLDVEVDHIVPLQSKIVCGLHVQSNLRIILAVHNSKKSNQHWPDMP